MREICKEIDRDKTSHYRFWSEPDKHKPHVLRQFRAPNDELKAIQRNFAHNLFGLVPAHESAHGGVKDRSPWSNAKEHVGQPWLINLDVTKFFSSVRHYVLADALRRNLRCGREVTWMLTRLMTLEAQLPQGAPTSTAAANFLLKYVVDEVVSERAAEIAAVNTRFVDDVSLSGAEPRPLINVTARALSRCRLSIHRPSARNRSNPKFRITPNSQLPRGTKAHSVVQQALGGQPDERVIDVCGREHRARKGSTPERNPKVADKHLIDSRLFGVPVYYRIPTREFLRLGRERLGRGVAE